MRKILLFLLLGVFCFSADGFKNLKWGSEKEEVIQEMGSDYKNDKKKNAVIYKNKQFSNLDLTSLTFIFKENKLTEWEAFSLTTKRNLTDLIEAYKEKYGVRSMYEEVTRDFITTTFEGEEGIVKIYALRLALPDNKVQIQIIYKELKNNEKKKETKEEYDQRLKSDL